MHVNRRRMVQALVGVGVIAVVVGLRGRLVADEVTVVRMGPVTAYRLLDLEWQPGPFPRSKIATLAGDPASGMHHAYLDLPDGAVLPPHWHSTDEYTTVIQGTVLVGHGDKIDEPSMRLFGPGAFVHIPAKTPHYVRAKGRVVLSQTRSGAADVHWVNPADDPTKGAAHAPESADKK